MLVCASCDFFFDDLLLPVKAVKLLRCFSMEELNPDIALDPSKLFVVAVLDDDFVCARASRLEVVSAAWCSVISHSSVPFVGDIIQ